MNHIFVLCSVNKERSCLSIMKKIYLQNIIFVTKVIALSSGADSTDIMTYNLVYGLFKSGYNLSLVLICESNSDEDKIRIREIYSPISDKLVILPSLIGLDNNKYRQLIKMTYSTYKVKKYESFLPDNFSVKENTLLISHSPSIESISISIAIRNKFKKKISRYIQYWSDPIALSGITPEALSYKRLPFILLEHRMLKSADTIVYGTSPLLNAQKKLYHDMAYKMRYIDVSYKAYIQAFEGEEKKQPQNHFLYAGNYNSRIRNVQVLFDAVDGMSPEVELDVYGSGDAVSHTPSVRLHGRITPMELERIEKSYCHIITVLNSKCIQIPGKIFYNMNINQNILVILDGPIRKEAEEYLNGYHRFELCDNTKDSIIRAMRRLIELKPSIEYSNNAFSPEAVAQDLIR